LGGNKWRKLIYNVLEAKRRRQDTLLTFGGAYSNHIYATAAAGNLLGFDTIGIIRGEHPATLSPTLEYAQSKGMKLKFISRSEYREKTRPSFIKSLREQFGDFYCLPEGGSNSLAIQGVGEVIGELSEQLPQRKTICCAAGTGGTLAGLVNIQSTNDEVLGIAVLKNSGWLEDEIHRFVSKKAIENKWSINNDYHFGGYAKYDQSLIEFIVDFKSQFNIQLEPVYTGKLVFGLFDLINNNTFSPGSNIVAIHSGGLQGLKGFKEFTHEKFQ